MEQERLCSVIESILFATEHPVSLTRLSEVFGEGGPGEEELSNALETIRLRYETPVFGFELRKANNGFHFVTKSGNAEYVQRFLSTKPLKLSRSAIEILAIVAYRQPITRAEMDRVRGIDSSHVLRVLMDHGLVKMDGKAEVPGRPVQYATTEKFLETVGLHSLSDLPPLSELEQIQGHTEKARDYLEEGLEHFIETTGSRDHLEEENQEELKEISDLINIAYQGEREVYASKDHQEIGESNQESLDAFQSISMKMRRKPKTARYEDLVANVQGSSELDRPEKGEPRLQTVLEAEIYGAIQEPMPVEGTESFADEVLVSDSEGLVGVEEELAVQPGGSEPLVQMEQNLGEVEPNMEVVLDQEPPTQQ